MTRMASYKLRSLFVALALGVAVVALVAKLEHGSRGVHAASRPSGDDEDDDDDDDDDDFDFLSSNVRHLRSLSLSLALHDATVELMMSRVCVCLPLLLAHCSSISLRAQTLVHAMDSSALLQTELHYRFRPFLLAAS